MNTSAGPHHGLMSNGRQGIASVLVRLVVNLAAPVLIYLLLRPHLHSDITALVIGAAIPILYTAVVFVWRRRVDAIGVVAIVCFVIGLLLAIATGGNELVFKLREDIWTGPLGLACLISLAVRRPLVFVVLQVIARRNTQIAERIQRPQARRVGTVSTGVIGAILLVHAVLLVILALTTSTTTFLSLSRPISLVVVGGGLVGLVWWIRRQYPAGRD
jgi:hypothetical protein